MALDVETRKLIDKVELDTGQILDMREKREERERDEDGDVMMDKEEVVSKEAQMYPVASSTHDEEKLENLVQKVEEMSGTVERMEGEMASWQWKAVETENYLERLPRLEKRVGAVEKRWKEGDPWTVIQSPRRRQRQEVERPVTRSRTHKLEKMTDQRVVGFEADIATMQMRIVGMEKVSKEWENLRKKVNGLDMRVASAEGEVLANGRKVATLEAKGEDFRLRQDLATREIAQGRELVNIGLIPRMVAFEARLKETEYRLATTETRSDGAIRSYAWSGMPSTLSLPRRRICGLSGYVRLGPLPLKPTSIESRTSRTLSPFPVSSLPRCPPSHPAQLCQLTTPSEPWWKQQLGPRLTGHPFPRDVPRPHFNDRQDPITSHPGPPPHAVSPASIFSISTISIHLPLIAKPTFVPMDALSSPRPISHSISTKNSKYSTK